MDDALQMLVAMLLKIVLSKMPIPSQADQTAAMVEPPKVQFVAQEEIARTVCGRPCNVRAFYLPERGIFLDETLHPEESLTDRSILLHEIVHHVQHHLNSYGEFDDCERYRRREREAYNLQNLYLMTNQSFVQFGKGRLSCPGEVLG